MAPVFESMFLLFSELTLIAISVACDHNMLTMEVLKEVAREHDMVVLLHEKPFAGVNGSGT